MSKDGMLFGLPAVLDLEAGLPRRLYVFNPVTMQLERVGGNPTSLLTLRGDPPDFVTIRGDTITVEMP